MPRGPSDPPEPARAQLRLPAELAAVLPGDVQKTWKAVAPVLPRELYLAGGTGVAVHLHHRESRDLDFFYHGASVDLGQVEKLLGAIGPFAVTHRGAGTLRGLFGQTKVEFLHADEVKPQKPIEDPQVVAGLPVAGLPDLMAMKLKVVRERGELRDYFDLKMIEEQGGLQIEDGLALFVERYELAAQDQQVQEVIKALGYLDDLDEDELLPVGKDELAHWWRQRQVRLISHLGRNPQR